MDYISPGWRLVSIGFEGDAVVVGGVKIWVAKWSSTLGTITVPHPQYPQQRHTMGIHEIVGTSPPVVFAAGAFSNGVWGIYTPAAPIGAEGTR